MPVENKQAGCADESADSDSRMKPEVDSDAMMKPDMTSGAGTNPDNNINPDCPAKSVGIFRTLPRRILKILIPLAFWLAVWQIVSMLVDIELLVPSVGVVLSVWLRLAATAEFWLSALLSLARVLIGFAVGTLLGFVCGFLTHYVKPARILLEPLMKVIRAVPVASFIILALVWIETEALPSFIAAAMAAPMVWQSISSALISDVDPKLLEFARVYSIPRAKIIRGIVLPSVLPAFISSAAGALGFAWKSGVAAEVICQPLYSIGRQLQNAKVYYETPRVFAWTCTVCILSIALEHILKLAAARYGKS